MFERTKLPYNKLFSLFCVNTSLQKHKTISMRGQLIKSHEMPNYEKLHLHVLIIKLEYRTRRNFRGFKISLFVIILLSVKYSWVIKFHALIASKPLCGATWLGVGKISQDIVMAAESTFTISSVVCGYHVYKGIWNAPQGQVLPCRSDRTNLHDPFAVSVVKDDQTVGHVPRRISAACSMFLRRNETITCRVIGTRKYSTNLPQGGLEIPCELVFIGTQNDTCKLKRIRCSIKFERREGG